MVVVLRVEGLETAIVDRVRWSQGSEVVDYDIDHEVLQKMLAHVLWRKQTSIFCHLTYHAT